MKDFMNKVTDIAQAIMELAAIDDPKNPPCTLVLQSGISERGAPAINVKMWIPVEGEPRKLDFYELTSEATPEQYAESLDDALASVRAKIRQQQGSLN